MSEKDVKKEIQRKRMVQWRREATIQKIDGPTKLDSARKLGYKAKQGFVMVRTKIKKGRRKIPKPVGGRRPRRAGRFFSLNKSKMQVAEEKASRKYPNMEVLGSYRAGQDGTHLWFETILVDTNHPSVRKDKERNWICDDKQKGRAFRGLTPAGVKSRGLRRKGIGAEKIR
ncbi:MAG: 50S ribosomal protein L15e [Candidatus Aenigmatarchaeota archaeon]